MSNEITNEWLESLAFFHEAGYPEHWRVLRTNGHEIETYPQFIDSEGVRRWYLNGAHVHPRPLIRRDVKNLLERLRRDVAAGKES